MTTAATIIDDALDKLLVFDQGQSDIGNDDPELFTQINKIVRAWYIQAATPPNNHERERDDFFAISESVTLSGSPPSATLSDFSWRPFFLNSDSDKVHIASFSDLRLDRAELPPAVYLRGLVVTSCGRDGDPASGDVLTAHFTPVPGTISDRAHFIGATTVTDSTTSKWPSQVADRPLVLALAEYLAFKSGDTMLDERQQLTAEKEAALAEFFAFVRRI